MEHMEPPSAIKHQSSKTGSEHAATSNKCSSGEQFKPRMSKGERRVRFADSMGMELVSIILFDLINNYYFASIHNHLQNVNAINSAPRLAAPPQPKQLPLSHPKSLRNSNPSPSSAASNTISTNNSVFNHAQQQQLSKQTFTASQASNATSTITVTSAPTPSTTTTKDPWQYQSRSTSATSAHLSQQRPPSSYVCDFAQPISLISFKERVKLNKVHLETCSVHLNAPNETISVSCSIRVLNLSYHKSVTLRLTMDDWHTHRDIEATFRGQVDSSADRFAANFSLSTKLNARLAVERVQFAVRYQAGEPSEIFWDNNAGSNYSLRRVNQL